MASSLVVLVFLLLGSGGVLDPVSAQDCDSADVDVGQGNVSTIYHEKTRAVNNMSTVVFLRPGSDFEGISVEVEFGQGTEKSYDVAWFLNDQQCYPDDNKWIPLEVEVVAYKCWNRHLDYTLKIGRCTEECTSSWDVEFIGSLKVVAHGSSRWKCRSPPSTCLAFPVSHLSTTTSCISLTSSCALPPSTDTGTANSPSRPAPCSATTTPSATVTTTPTPSFTTTALPTVTTTPRASLTVTHSFPSTATTKSTSTVMTTPTKAVTPTLAPTTTPTPAVPSLPPPAESTDAAPVSLPSTVVVTMAKVAMVVETVVIVVVVVALVPPMRQTMLRRQQSDPDPPSRNSKHVSMNSL